MGRYAKTLKPKAAKKEERLTRGDMPEPAAQASVTQILEQLEDHYGVQEPCWPTDPYKFLVWWYCGYPASDAACSRGWESLQRTIGVETRQILKASPKDLAAALKPGGMVPEIRAMRLKELAARVQDEFGNDLRGALAGSMDRARKILKSFHSIADPGADRILLFAGLAPIAAVPSNCPYVLVRIQHGRERENYGVTYREAKEGVEAEVPATFDALTRAFLLLKRHGQELCKRTKPHCAQCPVRVSCAYATGKLRGGASLA